MVPESAAERVARVLAAELDLEKLVASVKLAAVVFPPLESTMESPVEFGLMVGSESTIRRCLEIGLAEAVPSVVDRLVKDVEELLLQ